MADHPNVRRLKGQPDRWRKTSALERENQPIRIDFDLDEFRARIDSARQPTTPIGKMFADLSKALAGFDPDLSAIVRATGGDRRGR